MKYNIQPRAFTGLQDIIYEKITKKNFFHPSYNTKKFLMLNFQHTIFFQ